MSETVYIVGVGMTPFGKQMDKSIKDLTREAVTMALKDAGCEAGALQAAFFSNCTQGHMEGQDMIRGEVALRSMGIQGIPVLNIENACASASSALHLAIQYVKARGGGNCPGSRCGEDVFGGQGTHAERVRWRLGCP